MPFWGRRRGTSPGATDGSTARAIEPQADEPVRLYLRDGAIHGVIDSGGERMTDLLTSRSALRVQLEDGSWQAFAHDALVAVAPPPHLSRRRIHRARRRVEFTAPPYLVTGTAHLPPGTQLAPFVLQSGRIALPVTSAWIRTVDGDVSDDLDVVILLVRSVTMAREIMSIS